MTSDPLDILLRHNHWATNVLLARCAKLTPAQLQQPFEIGVGSLYATLDHIIGCVESWTARVRGQKRLKTDAEPSIEQLRVRNDNSTAELTELIAQIRLSNTMDRQVTVTFPQPGERTTDVTFTVAGMITHCLVHGSHHRAQALNMLRRLNLGEPLPELDVIDWQYEAENTKP